MTKAGERLIESAKEALAVARGERPAARITVAGHAYVPEVRWEPIDTAPKDGTEILGCWCREVPYSQLCYGVVWWLDDSWVEYDGDNRVSDPTHWMPLPAPPTTPSSPPA